MFAWEVLEFVRLICAFALGGIVMGFGGTASPANDKEARVADEKQLDFINVRALMRDGIALDPFRRLASPGGLENVMRYRASLTAFDAAMGQNNPDVATILLVSCIEALISPDTDWRNERLTTRFIRAVLDYAPSTVDAILASGNVEMTLGFRRRGGLPRQRQELLSHIYDLRSTPVHTGLDPAGSIFGSRSQIGKMRTALLSLLAERVILAFLVAPRTSLVGHPTI
jgi:hypothetical protein